MRLRGSDGCCSRGGLGGGRDRAGVEPREVELQQGVLEGGHFDEPRGPRARAAPEDERHAENADEDRALGPVVRERADE